MDLAVVQAVAGSIKSDFPPICYWWYLLVENQGLSKPIRAPKGRACKSAAADCTFRMAELCRWSVTSGDRFAIDKGAWGRKGTEILPQSMVTSVLIVAAVLVLFLLLRVVMCKTGTWIGGAC